MKAKIIVVGKLACREEDCEECPFRDDKDLCLKLKAEKEGVKIEYVEYYEA